MDPVRAVGSPTVAVPDLVQPLADPRHRDKNFGEKFALWDALFGTLYVPKEREILQVGLQNADPREFATVRQLYFLPFRNAFRECISSVRKRLPSALFLERGR